MAGASTVLGWPGSQPCGQYTTADASNAQQRNFDATLHCCYCNGARAVQLDHHSACPLDTIQSVHMSHSVQSMGSRVLDTPTE